VVPALVDLVRARLGPLSAGDAAFPLQLFAREADTGGGMWCGSVPAAERPGYVVDPGG
jgi:hypothetical protein